jgi:uncharacterized protein YrzB (UPF0473 family)
MADQSLERTISTVLQEAYGQDVMLVDDQGHEVLHRIVVEWTYGNAVYAVLAEEGQTDADEWMYVTAIASENGEWELDSIYDEDLWDQVSEWVDEWLFEQQSK